MQTDGRFENFCTVIGRRDLLDDPRFATGEDRLAHAAVLIDIFDETFARHDLAHWLHAAARPPDPVEHRADRSGGGRRRSRSSPTATWPRSRADPVPFRLAASPAQFDEAPLTLTPGPGHGEHTERGAGSTSARRGTRSSS